MFFFFFCEQNVHVNAVAEQHRALLRSLSISSPAKETSQPHRYFTRQRGARRPLAFFFWVPGVAAISIAVQDRDAAVSTVRGARHEQQRRRSGGPRDGRPRSRAVAIVRAAGGGWSSSGHRINAAGD